MGIQFTKRFSDQLKALKTEHNGYVWNRLTAVSTGQNNAGRALQKLLDIKNLAPDFMDGFGSGRAAHRNKLYCNLIIRNFLKSDPVLIEILKTASTIIRTIKSKYRSDIYKNTTQCLLESEDRQQRKSVWLQRQKLEEQLHPLVLACVDRRNQIALELGFGGFVDLWSYLSGLSNDHSTEILDSIEAVIDPSYELIVDKWQNEFDQLLPWDVLYLIHGNLKPFDPLFKYQDLLPVFSDFTERIGFDDRARELVIHPLDTPYNALTFIETVPDKVHILCNQTDGLRVWKILYHEFGHYVCARYNLQTEYAYQWDESPYYNECIGQLFNLFLSEELWLSDYMGEEYQLIRKFDKEADTYRYKDWMTNAKLERQIYQCSGENKLEFEWVREVSKNCTFPYHYFLNAPFHFESLLVGELFAKLIHKTLKGRYKHNYPFSPKTADFLIKNFFSAGSSIDWKQKMTKTTGISWNKPELNALASNLLPGG